MNSSNGIAGCQIIFFGYWQGNFDALSSFDSHSPFSRFRLDCINMEPIRVKLYPIASFETPESAIAHAGSHPQLADAHMDAAHLKDAVFVDACWNLFEWIIRFDCGTSLCVWIDKSKICWRLKPSDSVSIGDDYQRVGAVPVVFDWSGAVGLSEMDCSSLVSRRRGARFKDLFVADYGLLIYLHGHLILHLSAVERLSDGRSIMYASESE